MINVFIIDDHPAVIEGLAFMLTDELSGIQVTGSAVNMRQVTESLPNLDIQVIILDLFIGKDSPLENLNLVKNICPDAAIMIYSAEDSIQWKYRMFKAGVNAYLCKNENPDNIIPVIHAISNGSMFQTTADLDSLLSWSKMEIASGFTAGELEIGQKIANGLSLKEIAIQDGRSRSAIEKVLHRLRYKANANSNPDLIRILIQRKLILASDIQ